jgi:hypothetical protein
MSRVTALSLWVLAAGCGPRVALFDSVGALDGGCAEAGCPASDAGPRDAALPIGDPRFPEPGSAADFQALAASLDGPYYGVAVRGPRATRFEIDFEAGQEPGRGAFGVRCLDASDCDPFGPGSDTGGRYDLVSIDANDQGRGELSWGARAVPPAEFWRMTRHERVLSFFVGFLGVDQAAGAYASIVLSPGSWPDGGEPFTQISDGGAADAAAADAAAEGGAP